jgi:hypothetical protein
MGREEGEHVHKDKHNLFLGAKMYLQVSKFRKIMHVDRLRAQKLSLLQQTFDHLSIYMFSAPYIKFLHIDVSSYQAEGLLRIISYKKCKCKWSLSKGNKRYRK